MSTLSNKEIRLFSITFLILCSACEIQFVESGVTKCAAWEKVSSTNQRLDPRDIYTEMSLMTCARQCHTTVKRRGYFTHNSAQQTCACGVTLMPTPRTPGDSLYAPKCDEPGYSLHVLRSARVCVKYVNNEVNYAAAEAACLRDGAAYVFMIDSQEKIDLVRQIEPTEKLWVGLTDREEEGVYRWADGRLVNMETLRHLYKPGTPNDGEDVDFLKDCTNIMNTNVFNDIFCTHVRRYFCEIAIE